MGPGKGVLNAIRQDEYSICPVCTIVHSYCMRGLCVLAARRWTMRMTSGGRRRVQVTLLTFLVDPRCHAHAGDPRLHRVGVRVES